MADAWRLERIRRLAHRRRWVDERPHAIACPTRAELAALDDASSTLRQAAARGARYDGLGAEWRHVPDEAPPHG